MDSDRPNRPEGSHDQHTGQPYGSNPQGSQGQPTEAYPSTPPPPPRPQPQQPTQPYGTPTTPQAGDYGHGQGQGQQGYSQGGYTQPQQPQYGDRPASQPVQPTQQGGYQPQQYSDQPQYTQPPYYNQPPPNQVNVAPKKSNNGMLFGLLGLVVLALAAGAIWYFTRGGNNPLIPGGDSAMKSQETKAASVLPRDTLAYISVATNIEGSQKAAFDKMREAFEAQPGYKEAIERLTRQATGSSGSQANKMAQEIQGLITKYTKQISLAVLPPSTADWEAIKGGGQAAMADVAMRNLVGVADMDLAALKKDAKSSEVEETYKGIEVSRIVTGSIVFYTAPLDNGSVAVGLRPEPVRGLVDQVKDNKNNIRDDETYKYLSGLVPADRVGSFYMNLTGVYNQVEAVAPGQLAQSGIEGMSGAFLMTVSGQDEGLQLDMASQADIKSSYMNQTVLTAKPDASTFNDVPAGSMAFFVSTDLRTVIKSTLDSMSAASKRNGGPDYAAEAEKQVQQATGLSLQNDILPLLGGDYALSATPGDKQMAASSVVFQMKLNGDDRDKAADVLDKLMARAGGSSSNSIPTFDAAGGKFYDLSNMLGGFQGRMGLVTGVGKDRFMIVYTPDAGARAKLEDVSNNLGKGFGASDKWNTAKKHLPNDSNAVIYVDLDTIKGMYGSDIPSDAQPFINPFKYVIMGSANQSVPGSGNGTSSRGLARIFLGISK